MQNPLLYPGQHSLLPVPSQQALPQSSDGTLLPSDSVSNPSPSPPKHELAGEEELGQRQQTPNSSLSSLTVRTRLLFGQIFLVTVALVCLSILQASLSTNPSLNAFLANQSNTSPSFLFPLLVAIASLLTCASLLFLYHVRQRRIMIPKWLLVCDIISSILFFIGWLLAGYATAIPFTGWSLSNWPPNCSDPNLLASGGNGGSNMCGLNVATSVICLVLALVSVSVLFVRLNGHRFFWLLFVPILH